MKNTFPNIAGILLFAVLSLNAGCATYPSPNAPPVDKSMVFSVPYDIAWKKMMEAVTQEGALSISSDKAGGLIGFQRNIAPGDIKVYAFDDTGMFWSEAVAHVAIIVSPQDERSTSITINVKVVATGRDTFDVIFSRIRKMTLHSRGYMEKHYLASFSKLISAMKKEE